MSKKSWNTENKHFNKKSDDKESSEDYCFDNRKWKNYFCDEDYSEPPCFEEDVCKDNHHREKKNKEHEDCCEKEKLIKCKVVIAQKHVQKVGTLIIPAPIGVGIDIDTGKLTSPVLLESCGEPVFTPKITDNTLINQGYVPVKLIVKENCMEFCGIANKVFSEKFFIPFQSEIKLKGIKPDDEIDEKLKIESLAVFGFPEIIDQKCGGVITKLVLM